MEHYFRTALWMLFLIGCFQAASIARVTKEELGVNLLRKAVKIEGNVTFKFPKYVSDLCLGEAVNTIIKGLELAREHATSNRFGPMLCNFTIQVLQHDNTILPHNDSSDCKMQEERSLNFEDFLEEFVTIIDRINSK